MLDSDFKTLQREYDDDQFVSRLPPYWYDTKLRPCEHAADTSNVETVATHIGYSDFTYWRFRCKVCKRDFCGYSEG